MLAEYRFQPYWGGRNLSSTAFPCLVVDRDLGVLLRLTLRFVIYLHVISPCFSEADLYQGWKSDYPRKSPRSLRPEECIITVLNVEESSRGENDRTGHRWGKWLIFLSNQIKGGAILYSLVGPFFLRQDIEARYLLNALR